MLPAVPAELQVPAVLAVVELPAVPAGVQAVVLPVVLPAAVALAVAVVGQLRGLESGPQALLPLIVRLGQSPARCA